MSDVERRGPEDTDDHVDETVTDAEPVVEHDEIDLGEHDEADVLDAEDVDAEQVELEDVDAVDDAVVEEPALEAEPVVDGAEDEWAEEEWAEEEWTAEEWADDDPVEGDAGGDAAEEWGDAEVAAEAPLVDDHEVDQDAANGADDVQETVVAEHDDGSDDDRLRTSVLAALTGGPADRDERPTEVRPAVADDAPTTADLDGHGRDGDGGDDDGHDDGTTSSEERPRRRGRLVLLAAVAVLGVLYVAGYVLTGTRMPADASVGGVDVSGMSPAAARAAVEEGLAPRRDEPVVLVHDDETFEVDPADVGLALDPVASVEQAGGVRSWDPRDMIALVVGSHEHAPVVDVDDAALDTAVRAVAEAVDVPVTEALVTFPEAKPKPRAPKAGLVVRKGDTAQLVQDEYLLQESPAEVPTARVEPAVDEAGLRRALAEVAEPAVAAPVTIEVGDKDVDLPVTAYAPALTVEPVDGAMAPVIDAEKLAEPLTDATTGIGKKAVDATVVIRDGKPVVVPGKEGVGLQPAEMAEKLVPVLTETGDARRVQVEAKVVEPTFTTDDAKALRITEKISEFTTEYPHADYRNVNQGRAAEILNGTILEPGETFSFNDTVGERTAANGFTTGSVINNGRFQDELGGGVSQVVTTTYNAAFFAGLDDVEHHPHAFYIDRYPVGREATVYFGSLDLRFRNNLRSGVLIRAFVQPSSPGGVGRTTVQMWGTKEFEVKAGRSERRNFRTPATRYDDADDCVAQAPLQGFDIDIYRTISKGGTVVKRETDTARYQAADRIVCGEKPEDD